jgi:hypothetical protein
VITETEQDTRAVDVRVTNEGSLILFEPLTEAAREWLNLHIPSDATYWAGQLVVEHRFAYDLAVGMVGDGLRLE